MVKIYTRFEAKTARKPYPLGRQGSTPPSPFPGMFFPRVPPALADHCYAVNFLLNYYISHIKGGGGGGYAVPELTMYSKNPLKNLPILSSWGEPDWSLNLLFFFLTLPKALNPTSLGKLNCYFQKDKLYHYYVLCYFFRAHQNDLENIPIFLIIALLYMLSNLSPVRGIWCLRIFTAARILHTVGYLSGITRPRGMGFIIGSVCISVLAVCVLYSAVVAGVF